MENSVKRYVLTKCFLNSEKQIIPFWDPQIEYNEGNDENSPHVRLLKDPVLFDRHYQLTDCVYDIRSKTISLGIDINIYPEKTEFVVGQKVLSEDIRKHRHLKQDEIVEIVYEEFEMRICKGVTLTHELRAEYIPKEIDLYRLYVIKHWEPTYVLKSGMKTKWSHKLYHIVE